MTYQELNEIMNKEGAVAAYEFAFGKTSPVNNAFGNLARCFNYKFTVTRCYHAAVTDLAARLRVEAALIKHKSDTFIPAGYLAFAFVTLTVNKADYFACAFT